MTDTSYKSFLSSLSGKQWARIGVAKRSGVVTPLFSIYSSKSIGIGEIPDLKLLVDWCVRTGMSVIQLLPMNDVGFEFRPYDAQSSFALDPMYLSLTELRHVHLTPFKKEIEKMRLEYPAGKERVNYRVKGAKLELLWKIYQSCDCRKLAALSAYEDENKFWLRDYALYKTLKEKFWQSGWESWDEPYKNRDDKVLRSFEKEHLQTLRFHHWLQWQLAEQFKEVKAYGVSKKILFMGDLPFLVSRDSADVWGHQDYFKLDLVSGAPPDDYYAKGQRWGMPAYQWETIARHGYDYPVAKVKYAENFYDFFRIDHVVGVFRLWTIHIHEPLEHEGQCGKFDPADENVWEEHGRKILRAWIENTRMIPCAEDLGTVPACSYRVLEEFGIPGINVQRWTKNWGGDASFTPPGSYRKNSIAVISTHDSSSFKGWWEFEAGTVDEIIFRRLCEAHSIPFDWCREQLFDLKQSHHGRLRWRKDLTDKDAVLAALHRQEWEASKILDSYRVSYNEKKKFWEFAGMQGRCGEKSTPRLIERALEKVLATSAVFSIQLLQDWVSLDAGFQQDPWEFRINFPGTMNDRNWSVVMPFSLEQLNFMEVNDTILKLNQKSGRI
jgi:4-alpha-glucanotransferase